jgi:hypothetical protein
VLREKRGRQGGKTVTEEIKTRQTAEGTTSAVESGQWADTGSERFGAERKGMLPQISQERTATMENAKEQYVRKPHILIPSAVMAIAATAIDRHFEIS